MCHRQIFVLGCTVSQCFPFATTIFASNVLQFYRNNYRNKIIGLIEKSVLEIVAVELEKVGSKEWWLQYETTEKLCMQIRRSNLDIHKCNKDFILKHRILLPLYNDVKQIIELNSQK